MHKKDTLPVDIPGVGRLAASFKEPTPTSRSSTRDPKHPGVALAEASSSRGQKARGQGGKTHPDATKKGMT